MYEQKIREILGYDLPSTPKPVAAYIPANKVGDLIFTSGQLPIKNGKLIAEGKVGYEVGEEKAKECAQMCVVNCLSAIKSLIGDLDRIDQIVKLTVYVNSRIGYLEQPKIANGASEFLINVFGEKGKHARSAVGVSDLPLNAPVEVDMVVLVK